MFCYFHYCPVVCITLVRQYPDDGANTISIYKYVYNNYKSSDVNLLQRECNPFLFVQRQMVLFGGRFQDL